MDDDYVNFLNRLEPLINKDLDIGLLQDPEYLAFVNQFFEEQLMFEKLKTHILFAYSRVAPREVEIKRQWVIDAVIDNQFNESKIINSAAIKLAPAYRVIPVANNSDMEIWIPKDPNQCGQ